MDVAKASLQCVAAIRWLKPTAMKEEVPEANGNEMIYPCQLLWMMLPSSSWCST